MDRQTVLAYLDRISAPPPRRPDLDGLRRLQERHVLSVPYENIDVHLRIPIQVGAGAIDKVIRRRRGGSCRELNGAFAELLSALGYEVSVLAGRVLHRVRRGALLGHVLLRVDLEDPWLVDVGFGRASRYPLLLTTHQPQPYPHGNYRVESRAHGDFDVLRNGEPIYRIENRDRELHDLTPMLRWAETSPDGPYVDTLFCTLATTHGRVTLSGDTLTRGKGRTGTCTVLHTKAQIGFELTQLPPIPTRPSSPARLATITGSDG